MLLAAAPIHAILRTALHMVRHPFKAWRGLKCRTELDDHFTFLRDAASGGSKRMRHWFRFVPQHKHGFRGRRPHA
jgi:hypothetical protein